MGVGGGGGEAGGGHKAGEEGGGTGLTPCLQIQKLQVAWGRPSLAPRSQIPHPHHLSLQGRDSPKDWNPLKATRQVHRAPGASETHQSCGQSLWLYSPRPPHRAPLPHPPAPAFSLSQSMLTKWLCWSDNSLGPGWLRWTELLAPQPIWHHPSMPHPSAGHFL